MGEPFAAASAVTGHRQISAIEAAGYFRSVTLLRAPRPGDSLTLIIFADWLRFYNEWYQNFVVSRGRLWLMYGRQLTLSLGELREVAEVTSALSELARQLGFGMVVRLRLEECVADPEALTTVLDQRPSTVVIDAATADSETFAGPAVILASRLIELGVYPVLFGPARFWRHSGLLSSHSFNANHFLLVAHDPVREATDGPQPLPANLSTPCAPRFQVFIAPDGYAYPCAAIAGLLPYAMWHVSDRNPPMFKSSLHDLAEEGPHLSSDSSHGAGGDGLPLVCSAHRARLVANAAER